MLRSLSVGDLKVGHFIVLPPPWSRHPFLRNRFLLERESDIARLVEAGYESVSVDPSLCRAPLPPGPPPNRSIPTVPPPPPAPELVPAGFAELLRDTRRRPSEKARVLYNASLGIMERLILEPSPERLGEFRDTIGDVADVLLVDDDLAAQMLRITTHDFHTWTHSINVGVLSLVFARSFAGRDSTRDFRDVAAGFFLHDIGKVKVDSGLINKRGRFTPEERLEMQNHVARGIRMLDETGVLGPEARLIVAQHHERVDGSGYPDGLLGPDIDLMAKICMLADVYDALTSVRPYKAGMRPYEALKLMRHELIDDEHLELFERFVRVFE